MPAKKQNHVCITVFSSKANWESPVKLLELFPNANMNYQINKATKDANREICVAHLASVGRRRNEAFPSKLCPIFSPLRPERTDLYVFVRRLAFESRHKEPGPQQQRGNSPYIHFLQQSPFLLVQRVAKFEACKKERLEKVENLSQNGGFGHAFNTRSATGWRMVWNDAYEFSLTSTFGAGIKDDA